MRANSDLQISDILINDGVGVLPTDTLYGLVGRALSEKAVRRICRLKSRDDGKPFIILISSLGNLDLFNIKVSDGVKIMLEKCWPGKISVVLPCDNEKLSYLHMGAKSLAFRIPGKENLINLLKKTGPLVAPSANRSGGNSALTIEEAKKYFGEKVDFYVDEGRLESLPSTLIRINDGKVEVLRKGAVEIDCL
jgi:L-threonylcarbamoyladenylate synthase